MDARREAGSRWAAALRGPLGVVRGRWRGMTALARHITLVLLAKAVVLGMIWWAFFSAPSAPHMAMDPQRVEGRLLHPGVAAEASHVAP